jgi:hypothetical protein
MAKESTRTAGAADVLDAAGRNLRQAQQRLATLLAAARLVETTRARKAAMPLAPPNLR